MCRTITVALLQYFSFDGMQYRMIQLTFITNFPGMQQVSMALIKSGSMLDLRLRISAHSKIQHTYLSAVVFYAISQIRPENVSLARPHEPVAPQFRYCFFFCNISGNTTKIIAYIILSIPALTVGGPGRVVNCMCAGPTMTSSFSHVLWKLFLPRWARFPDLSHGSVWVIG